MSKISDTSSALDVPPVASSGVGWVKRMGSSRWAALPVLMAGTFLIVLDFFIVNVALPSIQADLHTGTAALEWVVAGYGLTFAVFLITAGRIADEIGRRRMFSIGLALFAVTSAACAAAPSPAVLVTARLAQGIGAAMISSTVLAIIGVVYTGGDRARAISVYGIVMGVAAAGGQLVGGLLISADVAGLGWRAVFVINLPVAAMALVLVRRLVPESRAEHAKGVDPLGVGLFTLGIIAVALPLIEGRQAGWPPWTWVSLGVAPIVFALLGAHQRRMECGGRAPLLDPALLKVAAFRTGLLTQVAYWCSQASFYLVLALYLQQGRGIDPLDAGLVFTILAAAYLATSLRAPALTLRFGRSLIAVGSLLLAAGFGLLSATVATAGVGGPVGVLAPGLVLIGAGKGLCVTPLTMTVLSHADPQRAGIVSGALSTMQQAGNTLGVAITGVIFFGALSGGYAHAFELSLAELTCLLVVVAGLTRLLPAHRRPS